MARRVPGLSPCTCSWVFGTMPPMSVRNLRTSLELCCVVVSGLGVGWLMGLSASPVLQGVLSVLLALTAGVTSVFTGIEVSKNEESKPVRPTLTPLPTAILVISIVAGSAVGVAARSNQWLGP